MDWLLITLRTLIRQLETTSGLQLARELQTIVTSAVRFPSITLSVSSVSPERPGAAMLKACHQSDIQAPINIRTSKGTIHLPISPTYLTIRRRQIISFRFHSS